MDEEVNKALEELSQRLKKVENVVFVENQKGKIQKRDYKGLAGGIRLLIDNKFLDQPKTLESIIAELNREGYYNTYAGVASTLSVTFVNSQKALSRIKQDNKWAYVRRK